MFVSGLVLPSALHSAVSGVMIHDGKESEARPFVPSAVRGLSAALDGVCAVLSEKRDQELSQNWKTDISPFEG